MTIDFSDELSHGESTAPLFARLPQNGFHRDVRQRIACEASIRTPKNFRHRFPAGGTAFHAP
jgi:hypothetical protein